MGEGKDHMDVWRLEHLAFPGGKPGGLGGAVTFGAAAVPARVVRLDLVPTVVTLRDMSPEGNGPAQGDGPQSSVLRPREGGPIACQKGFAMLAHHIGDFDLRLRHGSWSTSTGKVRASRGLSVACTALAATCK